MIEISHANVFSLDTLGIVFPILAIVVVYLHLFIQLNLLCIFSLVNINRMLYLKST